MIIKCKKCGRRRNLNTNLSCPVCEFGDIKDPLTPKQKRVLDFLLKFRQRKGYMPSQREIAEHFDWGREWTWEILNILERKKWIKRKWNQKRWIKINL